MTLTQGTGRARQAKEVDGVEGTIEAESKKWHLSKAAETEGREELERVVILHLLPTVGDISHNHS